VEDGVRISVRTWNRDGTTTGETEVEAVLVRGGLAVHRTLPMCGQPDSPFWTVSHIESGLRVFGRFRSRAAAESFAERLIAEDGWDWRTDPPEADIGTVRKWAEEYDPGYFGAFSDEEEEEEDG
jgi:hypothetical protein